MLYGPVYLEPVFAWIGIQRNVEQRSIIEHPGPGLIPCPVDFNNGMLRTRWVLEAIHKIPPFSMQLATETDDPLGIHFGQELAHTSLK